MTLPRLTVDDIPKIVPNVTDVMPPKSGGQKIVFPCKINNQDYVLKFMLANPSSIHSNQDSSIDVLDEVTARARREVEIMRTCTSPYLVKLGPIPLTQVSYNNQDIIFFSEEYIEGEDLKSIIQKRVLSNNEVIKLGTNISKAIKDLWDCKKVHRDVKPGNIIYSKNRDEYILLDMGLAFDLEDQSLTAFGFIPGTAIYLSPEQTEIANKRLLDFRSDLFSLGIVMYEAITGNHPFYMPSMTSREVIANILSANVPLPSVLNSSVISELDNIIIRLLAKRPHLRYRTCSQLITELEQLGGI